MRKAGRIFAWIVLVVAGLATLLLAAIAIDNDGDPDLIFGGLLFGGIAALVALGAFFAQRALRERTAAEGKSDAPNAELLRRALEGETVELRPRRLKWALILLGSVVFSAVMIPAAILAPQVLTVSGALLFGAGAVLSAWALAVPGSMYLRISPEGFVSKVPVRTRRYRWNDVENFRVFEVRARYHTSEFVGFDHRDRTHENQTFMQTVNRGVSGVDEGLSDNYGLDPEELASAMNELRARHATERGPSPSQEADRRLEAQAAKVDTSRTVLVTHLITLACLVVYVLEATRYGLSPTVEELLELGAATRDAEPWALLTGNFLHADPFHIVFNLIAWAIAGHLLEREIGAPRMAALVVLASVASMGFAVLLSPDAVTVGLSGVVFAALAWGVLKDPHRTRALGTTAWAMLPLGVIYTFLSSGTSIGGHLGGLAAGLLLGRLASRS